MSPAFGVGQSRLRWLLKTTQVLWNVPLVFTLCFSHSYLRILLFYFHKDEDEDEDSLHAKLPKHGATISTVSASLLFVANNFDPLNKSCEARV